MAEIKQIRIRLAEVRMKINGILDSELAFLDMEDLRLEKEGQPVRNGARALPPIDDTKEDEPIPIEVIVNKGKSERD